jgi:integrase
MAHIQKRGAKRWVARYTDPEGRERARSFGKKSDAEKFLAATEHSVNTGAYVDPALGKLTVGEWYATWFAAQGHLKPSTRARYKSSYDTFIVGRWGDVSIANITTSAVQSWCASIGANSSPSAAVKAHRVLSLMLTLAVRDSRLVRNPADTVQLPREVQAERRYLTHEQVFALADAAKGHRLVVLFLAYTGCRFGEMAALRVRRFDELRRRVEIAEAVTAVNGTLVWGTPKGHARRWVSVPKFIAEEIARRVRSKSADELIFKSSRGQVLRASNFRRDVFNQACSAAGLGAMHPHELRHTAASLAIASGANVKVVQSMLGHKSATLTLDLYGHLFTDQLDSVADALDAAARAALDPFVPDASRSSSVTPLDRGNG